MPQGRIKTLVSDRGFGFVEADQGDMFFHHSDVEGVTFDDLREGQTLQYEKGHGPKGPRATKIRLVETTA
jgi:CspA family cold shock protein